LTPETQAAGQSPECDRVLIIDDEPMVLDALSKTVRQRMTSVMVDTADTSHAALEQIVVNDYDAIVSDIRMPDIDGLTLLKEIRAHRPNTPTLLITGYAEQGMAIQALRAGAYDYIPKPLDFEYFLVSLNRAVQMRRLSRQVDRQKAALEQHAAALEQTAEERTRELRHEIAERKQAEEALKQANLKLTDWVSELERRTQEITLLSEMSGLLQTCQTVEEALTIAAQFLKQFFTNESGSICLFSRSPEVVEIVSAWGPSQVTESEFAPEECWALRRVQPHLMGDLNSSLICRHLCLSQATNYLCIPMMGHGEALGVLVLQCGPSAVSPPADRRVNQIQAKQHLAEAVANHIALALANLRLRETLRSESIKDALTGLYNRRYMEKALHGEVRRAVRRQHSLGLIMIDLDHFKQFNDRLSYEVGDALLKAMAQYLKARIREQDIACRYGGDEFVLILPETSLDVATRRAEKLREEIKQLNVEHDFVPPGSVSLSLGVAVFPEHASSAEGLMRIADRALHQAKAQGRDCISCGQVLT
jgi:diguanylate cyclase (GGDEF)-like protein